MSGSGTWTSLVRPAAARPTGRVVAIPHAGAGPHALLPLLEVLPCSLDVLGVTLPGRGHRWNESIRALAADPFAVADALTSEIAMLPTVPTVLFGHSLGAGIAAAAASARPGLFDGVVLSAFPGRGNQAQRAGRWSDEELVEIMRCGDGDLDDLGCTPGWRRSVLDRLRSDLTLAVRLAYTLRPDALHLPVTVLSADADPVAPNADLDRWRGTVTAELRTRTFAGGHFYLLNDLNVADVAGEITRSFRAELPIAS